MTRLPVRNTTTPTQPTTTAPTAGTPSFAMGTLRGYARAISSLLGSYRAIRTEPPRDRNGAQVRHRPITLRLNNGPPNAVESRRGTQWRCRRAPEGPTRV